MAGALDMRFLFISQAGDSIGIALRVKEEGNEVRMWCVDAKCRTVGDGLVDKFTGGDFQPSKDDIIVFDETDYGDLADMFRRDGYKIVGGSVLADKLEADREFSFEVMTDCGIRVPEYTSFNSWEDGKAFASDLKEKAVFKPSGDMELKCSSSVLEPDELRDTLERLSGEFPKDAEFEIQEFVEGVDLSTEGWFNGHDFVEPFNHTLETKKFMDGDQGPSEGCTGNIVWATTKEDPIIQACLLPLTPFLREHNYIGPLDINVIIAEDGPYALEFTPRFGYDATPTLFYELLDGEVGEFLSGVARGEISEFPLKKGYAAGLRLSIPPWPNLKYEAQHGVAVGGLRGSDYEHFCPMNVMMQDEKLVTSGQYGVVGILTGYGATIEESFKTPYRIANKIELPSKQYRSDMVEYFKKKHRKVLAEVSV